MNTANLIWGLIFGSIGLGYFIYGKRQSNIVVRYTGIALILYPYFFSDYLTLILVGIGLMLVPRFVEI